MNMPGVNQRDVCKRYLEGHSLREVARDFGICLQRVHQILIAHNIERRPAHNIKNSAKHRQKARAHEEHILQEALAIKARRKVS